MYFSGRSPAVTLDSVQTAMHHLTSTCEHIRLEALDALEILDTPAEDRFDRFTRLAAMTFGVPIVLVSLVGANRQWFKSRCGIDVTETPRSIAFCSHAVALGDMLVVEDATRNPRFADNPFVTAAPHIRFYAGQPLFSDGQAVGTLCILDRVPRLFGDDQRRCLHDLASLVEAELIHAKVAAARLMAEQALKSLNTELEHRVTQRTAELAQKVEELSQEIAHRKAIEVTLQNSEAWNRTIVAASYSGFVGADAEGRIIEWNASAERIFGWARARALGSRLSDLIVPPSMRVAHEQGMLRYLETGTTSVLDRKVEVPALTASGRQITIEMTISIYEWQGQRCFGAFMNDISERIRTQQLLEEKQELLDAVLESIDVAVVACDSVGNLSMFNHAARTLHGLDPMTISPAEWSRHYSLFHADGHTPLAMDEVPLVRVLKGETVRDQTMVVAPKDRRQHTLLASGRLLRSSSGRSLGAVVAMKDITELNASRERLEVNERRLRAITENLPAMIGKVNTDGKFAFLNALALQTYGKTSEELLGKDIACAYRVEDYAKLVPFIAKARAGEHVLFEYVADTHGREQHYQCSFVPQRDLNGNPDGFYAMAINITERKISEMRLAESEERLRTITDNVPVLIAHLDSERRYAFANAVHESWLGQSVEQMRGKTMEDVFGTAFDSRQIQALERAWKGQASQCEHDIVRKKHTRIVHTTFLPQLRDGAVVGVYALTTDATASRLHERSLHALAHTDTLTGLPNRRHFEARLAGAANEGSGAGHAMALLYLDVDHFKQINDSHGHAVGDAVLVEFAKRLRASIRSSDLVARLAGDEFTVLLNEVHSQSDVERIAQKIITAMQTPFVLGGRVLPVRTTIGGALTSMNQVSPNALMEAAGRALYAAKNRGRNTYAVIRLGNSDVGQLALATST